jgi:HD-GYP domain-containing protein (c-di-GMP phosphodiesterase class II)
VRLVATTRLAVGAHLARDVVSGRAGEAPLLRAGRCITGDMRDALLRAGINGVYIDDEIGAGIEIVEAISPETRTAATEGLSRALGEIASSRGRELPAGAVAGLEEVVASIAADVSSCEDAAVALADLAAADAYTLQHSIDVTVVGLLVAKRVFRDYGWIDFRGDRKFTRLDEKLTRIGMGLLLHDIGKITIPTPILNKKGKLTPEEWELVRGHPRAGLELLSSDLIGAAVKGVVRSHHERWDGSGYPDGRSGSDIYQFARIAAVADVFDAVTSERPYRAAQPPHVGVEIVVEGSGTSFDPEVAEAFGRVVAPYPPGSEITLSDGRMGVVVSVDPEALNLPLVRVAAGIIGYEIDLRDEPELAPGSGADRLLAGSRAAL